MIRKGKNWFSIIRDIVIILGVIYFGIFLYFGALPNVVVTEIKCPEYFTEGMNGHGTHDFSVSLTNHGGSNSKYFINISTEGFKCRRGSFTVHVINEIEKWNAEYNTTICTCSYFIGEGTSWNNEFTIFTDTDLPEEAAFEVKYKFETFSILPSFTVWTGEYPVIRCEYKLTGEGFYNRKYELI